MKTIDKRRVLLDPARISFARFKTLAPRRQYGLLLAAHRACQATHRAYQAAQRACKRLEPEDDFPI